LLDEAVRGVFAVAKVSYDAEPGLKGPAAANVRTL
jgi:cold shock CspA family protein